MLKLALPNGSLEKKTIQLFTKAGWNIKREGRKALCETDCPFVESVFFTRPQAIPGIVANGICDVGICGTDCAQEEICKEEYALKHISYFTTFSYSKTTNGPTRMVVCARTDDPAQSLSEIPPNSTIYSEYPHFTEYFLCRKDVSIIPSPGSTEGHVLIKQYDYGVCVTESGDTLLENGLRALGTLLISPTIIIATNPFPEKKLENKMRFIRRLIEKS